MLLLAGDGKTAVAVLLDWTCPAFTDDQMHGLMVCDVACSFALPTVERGDERHWRSERARGAGVSGLRCRVGDGLPRVPGLGGQLAEDGPRAGLPEGWR